MRTSLVEIEKIEQWLQEQGETEDRLVTEARIISSPEWQDKARYQAEAYEIIRYYGREQLRQEIKVIEKSLFQSPQHKPFQNLIKSIFKR